MANKIKFEKKVYLKMMHGKQFAISYDKSFLSSILLELYIAGKQISSAFKQLIISTLS